MTILTMIEQATAQAGIDAEAVRIRNTPSAKQRGAKYWAAFIYELRKLIEQQQAELLESHREAAAVQMKATELRRQLFERPSSFELLVIRSRQERDALEQTYRELATKLHPDAGGNSRAFQQLQADYETVLELLDGKQRTAADAFAGFKDIFAGRSL